MTSRAKDSRDQSLIPSVSPSALTKKQVGISPERRFLRMQGVHPLS